MAEDYILSAGQIFTLFFVMLGPLKMLSAFAKATQKMSSQELKKISYRAVGFATASLLIGGFLGRFLLLSWQIPVAILQLTSGAIFLLMAFSIFLQPTKEDSQIASEGSEIQAPRIAFSMIVTPYGVAVIV